MASLARALLLVVIAGGIGLALWLLLPDERTLPANESSMNQQSDMRITSTAFEEGGIIPAQYTCDGANMNPPLAFSGVPENARSLVLIADDPDVPTAILPDGMFVHWVLFNIPKDTAEISEGGFAGTPGANTRGDNAYTGPCPPTQYEPTEHRYFFKLYALDTELDLQEGARKEDALAAMEGHVLAEAQLMGVYDRAGTAE